MTMTYHETQYLRNNRIFWIVIPMIIIIAAVNISLVYQSSSNQGISYLIALILVCFSMLFIFLTKLNVEIDSIGITYQFFPFHFSKKSLAWDEINRAYIRQYDPLIEYGGWGIKGWKKSNKAINIKGKVGLQLELKSGNRLLIGTSNEKEMQQFLDQFAKLNINALN